MNRPRPHPLDRERAQLAKLRTRAERKAGAAFADQLCEDVEDACAFLRLRRSSGAFPAVEVKRERKEVSAIFAAARELMNRIWQASPETRRHLFLGRQGLLDTIDAQLEQLLDLAEQHLGELPRSGKPADYLREAIMSRFRATFKDHGVRFTATAYPSESGRKRAVGKGSKPAGRVYTGLAVDAVMIAFDMDEAGARQAIRDHAKRRAAG